MRRATGRLPGGGMPRQRRILLVGDAANPNVQRWVRHCVSVGYETYLLTCATEGPEILGVHRLDGPGWAWLPGPLTYLFSVPRLRRTVREIAPDIVHAHYGGGYGVMGALSGSSTLVISLWGSDVLVSPADSRVRSALLRWMLRQAVAVCVNSRHLAQAAAAYTALPIHLTYFGVEPLFYTHHAGERAPGESLRLATVKTFTPNSGIDTLLSAMRRVKDAGVAVSLVAVGPDPGGRAEAMTREMDLGDSVRFVGLSPPATVAEVMRSSDVYVQPTSFAEGFGIAVLEAQACWLPAIVSNVGGLVEAVDPTSGTVVPPRDPDALAAAIIRWANDRQGLQDARRPARAFAEGFRWEKVAPAMDAVYDMINRPVGAPKGPGSA